jgi:hypothetical protein
MMRTTLNLDDDVVAQISELSKQQHRPISRVANDLIRTGLRALREPAEMPAYSPLTFDTGQPLVDVTDVAEALEVLDRGG